MSTADAVRADPHKAWRAMQLLDARNSFADFCALIEIPQAPLKDAQGIEVEGEEAEEPQLAPIRREEAAHLVLRRDAIGLRSALGEAVAWLHTTPAPRAITIRSHFPRYALDSVDVARLPADITLTLEWVESRAWSAGAESSPVLRDTIDWVTSLDSASIARVIRTVEEGGGDGSGRRDHAVATGSEGNESGPARKRGRRGWPRQNCVRIGSFGAGE